jgi:hypothetical protein
MVETINIIKDKEIIARKILLANILKSYHNYTDAFHGTKFEALASIAKLGLRPPGSSAGSKTIAPVPGHIPRGAKVNGI